MTNQTMNGGN